MTLTRKKIVYRDCLDYVSVNEIIQVEFLICRRHGEKDKKEYCFTLIDGSVKMQKNDVFQLRNNF